MGDAPDPTKLRHRLHGAVPAPPLPMPVHRHRDGPGRRTNISPGTVIKSKIDLCRRWLMSCTAVSHFSAKQQLTIS